MVFNVSFIHKIVSTDHKLVVALMGPMHFAFVQCFLSFCSLAHHSLVLTVCLIVFLHLFYPVPPDSTIAYLVCTYSRHRQPISIILCAVDHSEHNLFNQLDRPILSYRYVHQRILSCFPLLLYDVSGGLNSSLHYFI